MKKSRGMKATLIETGKFDFQNNKDTKLKAYSTILPKLFSSIQKAAKVFKFEQENFSNDIKEAHKNFWSEITTKAESIGIDLIGFAPVNEKFIFIKDHISGIEFPILYDNAIVLGMEMKFDAIDTAPDPLAGMESMRVYAELGVATNILADFIKNKGYKAIPCHPLGGPILYPPMAVEANLGEIGRNGLLITKQFGPRQRLSMIATNAFPIPKIHYEDFGISEFCKKCGICSNKCPGGAILDQPIIQENGRITRIDNKKCFPYFYKTSGCSICIKECPFHKKGYEKIFPQN
ncbi:MAG: hypothetical protein ACTSWY_02610 [Promethearchaeota archaeon]